MGGLGGRWGMGCRAAQSSAGQGADIGNALAAHATRTVAPMQYSMRYMRSSDSGALLNPDSEVRRACELVSEAQGKGW